MALLLTKTLIVVLLVAKSLSTSSDDGVKYANRCEGMWYPNNYGINIRNMEDLKLNKNLFF